MSNKTWASWEGTRVWCLANPGKTAAIVTPQGTFTVAFTPTKAVYPCLCNHEKGDHQMRIGQRGNYTPCCIAGCKCDGFRAMKLMGADNG